MPLIRTIGNTIFAMLLGVLSRQSVVDTASGMRVIRRSALRDLYPLPDGLHFTPAMSARVLLQDSNHHQAGHFAVGARRRVQADFRQAGDFLQEFAEGVQQFEHTLHLIDRLIGMQVGERRHGRRTLVQPRVVLHRTRTQRIEVGVDAERAMRELCEVPHQTQLRHFWKRRRVVRQ